MNEAKRKYKRSAKGKAAEKRYREKNKAKVKAGRDEYNARPSTKVRQKEWYASNKENRAVYMREYNKKRITEDPEYLLARRLRTRLYHAIQGNFKAGSAIDDLGCTIAELKERFEQMFSKGMTWDNYGEWHVDHIKPLISFNLTNREEFLQACHYSNLQPLWAVDNISKGSTYDVGIAPSVDDEGV